jgi:hypothetical protein
MLTAAATALAVTMAPSMNIAITKQAFAVGGQCSSCGSSFTPKLLSSGLSDTDAHDAEKIFAP